MIETGKIINGDCVEVMKTLPEGSVDLIVTSPPYGVGIVYDVHEDDVEFNEYVEFAKNWLSEA
jgi:site-specific DNA-methyltransferase (adenine-specific)